MASDVLGTEGGAGIGIEGYTVPTVTTVASGPLASDIISLVRIYLNDPSTLGRWSDQSLLVLLNQAQNELIRDVEFPESRLTTTTVLNAQEYTLPSLIKIYRVYVAGQLIVPTTLQALEGHQTQDYDQGLNSGIPQPGTQTAGSGGPTGTSGSYTPAWNIQPPVTYPFANSWGSPAPDAQMWAGGQRPRYYLRGGFIGIVPAPAGAYSLVIDCLLVPAQITGANTNLIFPINYSQALAWKVCEMAYYADDGDRAADQRTYASQQYERQMRKLRTDRKQYDGDQPRMPKLYTYRRGRQIGNNRQGEGFTEYP